MCKKIIFIMLYTIVLLVSSGKITFGQERIEKIGQKGLLFVSIDELQPITSFDLSTDRNTIAVSTSDGQGVYLYSLRDLKISNLLTGPKRFAREIKFSPDNKLVACGDDAGLVWVWSTADGKLMKSIKAPIDSSFSQIHSITFSNDGNSLAIGTADLKAFVFDTRTWQQTHILEHNSNVTSVRYSPDDSKLAAGTRYISPAIRNNMPVILHNGRIALWDLKTKSQLYDFPKIRVGDSIVSAVTFSPDGHMIAGGNADGEIGIWKVDDGSLITNLKKHSRQINDLSFSHNGLLLGSASSDSNVIVWDIRQSSPLKEFKLNGKAWSIAFWQEDKVLNISDDKGISFYSISDGKQLCRLLFLKGGKFIIYTPEGYYETDAIDRLQVKEGTQQTSIKESFLSRSIVLNSLSGKNVHLEIEKRKK
jgi:WD40 repeat protein